MWPVNNYPIYRFPNIVIKRIVEPVTKISNLTNEKKETLNNNEIGTIIDIIV